MLTVWTLLTQKSIPCRTALCRGALGSDMVAIRPVEDLIAQIRATGATIWRDGEFIVVAARCPLPLDLADEIRIMKSELLAALANPVEKTDWHARYAEALARARIASMGRDAASLSDDDIRGLVIERDRRFREEAPTSAAEAATIILDGVKAERWRILVGPDAHVMDEMVRQSPERAYDLDCFEKIRDQGRLAPPDANGAARGANRFNRRLSRARGQITLLP
jgi:hypothetical protein